MVIICPADLSIAWQALADTRTKQGIITIVKTVEWIEQNYSGCDIQERIRNFLADANSNWGITMVLLGGDDETVPARRCNELSQSSENGYPADDYYGDLTGNWCWSMSGEWYRPGSYDLELFVGRVPADTPDEVAVFTAKEQAYENPLSFPSGFARKILLIGDSSSSLTDGTGACRLEALNQTLITAGIAGPLGEYLDTATELYFPASGSNSIGDWSGDLLSRASAIADLNAGYNIVLHLAHSGIHQIGAGAPSSRPVREYVYQGDMLGLTNTGQPSILYTCGCWPGGILKGLTA